MGAIQPLNVIPPDQPARRVAHHIDALAAVCLHQLLNTVGHDACDFLYRLCVEAPEQPAELNDVSTVSRPTESSHEGAQGEGRGEETM